VEQIIEIKLNEEEKMALNRSADAVRKLVEDMKRLS
jgi:malate/lactate dehydrogenase